MYNKCTSCDFERNHHVCLTAQKETSTFSLQTFTVEPNENSLLPQTVTRSSRERMRAQILQSYLVPQIGFTFVQASCISCNLLCVQQCTMNSRNSYFNFVIMWQSSKISAMYFMDKDSKLSNLFQQASSPTTGTAPRSQSRLSVCPSTQDICRYVLRKIYSHLAYTYHLFLLNIM